MRRKKGCSKADSQDTQATEMDEKRRNCVVVVVVVERKLDCESSRGEFEFEVGLCNSCGLVDCTEGVARLTR